MRAWDNHTDALEARGATLLVLSGDERELLTARVAEHGFDDLLVAPASPEDWEAFGVKNERRETLPHPTTLVLAPDGTVRFREVHRNFRRRTDPERALAALDGGPSLTEEHASIEPTPWDRAATTHVLREPDRVRFVLEIADGFHAYGAEESTGVPVYLRIDDGPRATAPPGEEKAWSGGTSYVLEGRVELVVEVEGSGPVRGQIGWQLCTDSSCSAPRNEPFEVGRPAE